MSQLEHINKLNRESNNAFAWLNRYVETLNHSTPNFIENCEHNVEFAKHVMYVANLILEKNEEILAEVTKIQGASNETN